MMKFSKGFTLIELILVIMILGIISTGLIGFITTGVNIYKNIHYRDVLISDARFVVERLNREVRQALPNSVRLLNQSGVQCMEFAPVHLSTIYLDVPVSPESADNNITVIQSSLVFESTNSTSKRVVVFPENLNDAYDVDNGKAKALQSVDTSGSPTWDVFLQSNSLFAADSPNERLYIIDQPVSFCIEGDKLYRYHGYGFNTNQQLPNNSGQLMAEHIVANASRFSFDPNNAMLTIDLIFNNNNEQLVFNNGVHIANVP